MYLQPRVLDDALAALAAAPRTVLAGGTDFYATRVGRPVDDTPLIDITRIDALRGIDATAEGWRIGAATSWTDVVEARLPGAFRGLQLAAREVGGVQIQNTGTIAGNLCNASPAADGVPALLALGASVELASVRGRRVVPLESFITGPRRTARAADELVTAVLVPRWPDATRASFLKLGARKYLVISIAMAAATIEPDAAGRVQRAAVAIGACSPVALRLPALEARLIGRPADASLGDAVAAEDFARLAPIDDVRATRAYRIEAAIELTRRTLRDAAGARA